MSKYFEDDFTASERERITKIDHEAKNGARKRAREGDAKHAKERERRNGNFVMENVKQSNFSNTWQRYTLARSLDVASNWP
jgi:hypothetical protein